jgi:hypothetical protein
VRQLAYCCCCCWWWSPLEMVVVWLHCVCREQRTAQP